MKLYGTPNSRTRRCLWALEEAGAEYELISVQLSKGEHRRPEYLAINPGGKVPALVDGELTLLESAAICNYIGEKYPEQRLTPPGGSADRPRYDQWMFFVIGELEQPLWTIGKHRFVLPEERRVPAMLEVARYEWTIAAGLLARALEGREVLVGGHFTMADVLAAQTLAWARSFELPLGHDRLERYADQMLARPAFRRTLDPVQEG